MEKTMLVVISLLFSYGFVFGQDKISETQKALKVFEEILQEVQKQNQLIMQSMQVDEERVKAIVKTNFSYFLSRALCEDSDLRKILNPQMNLRKLEVCLVENSSKNIKTIISDSIYSAQDSSNASAFGVNLNDPLAKNRLRLIQSRIEEISNREIHKRLVTMWVVTKKENPRNASVAGDHENVWQLVLDLLTTAMIGPS